MKQNRTAIIVIVLSIGLLALLFYLFASPEKYYWYETYRSDDKNPYGCYVVSELLKTYNPDKAFVPMDTGSFHSVIGHHYKGKNANYVFVGQNLYLDSADVQDMLAFVEKGNTVFIASRNLPTELTLNLRDFQCYWRGYHEIYDSTVHFNFFHPGVKADKDFDFSFMYKDQKQMYDWAYYNEQYLCEYSNTFTKLGYFRKEKNPDEAGYDADTSFINFVRIPYGTGFFYFHTNPVVFTNYFMVDAGQLKYADKVFSHLDKGDVYWDEFGKLPHWKNHNNEENHDHTGEQDEGPLKFLLQQQSMKWSIYTLLIGVVLTFILFRAKRKQRIIPLLEPNTNTSLEFVNTIGRLYFLQNNHRGLARQMMRHFMAFIRNHYYIGTVKVNDELAAKISVKSRIPVEKVKEIFSQFNWLNKTASQISDEELIKFYQTLEYFYKNCK